MRSQLSTRDLADAVGVSESSIKRWVDGGRIPSARTAGGHRRIALGDAIRFVREEGLPVVRPDLLGLADTARAERRGEGADEDRLFAFLAAGEEAEARGLLLGLYLDGTSIAGIVDGPVRGALRKVGELWRNDPDGIVVEHRAVDLCIRALSELRSLLPRMPGAPVAVGGAVADDPYLLPSIAAAAVLADEGFETVNLGPDVPTASFVRAVERYRPRLVWITASVVADPEGLSRGLSRLVASAGRSRASVVLGGRAASSVALPRAAGLQTGGSMAELAAFARGLRASAA